MGAESPQSLLQLLGVETPSLPSPSTTRPNQADLSGSPVPLRSLQIPSPSHNTSDSLDLGSHITTRQTTDDVASFPVESAEQLLPSSNRQEQFLSDELTAIPHASAPATKELVDLLQGLGKVAPKAIRNKHKIYSILRVGRDIYNYTIELGNFPESQSDPDIKTLLHRMEDYFMLCSLLEEALLEFAAILSSEITAFGTELYSSWSHSRSELTGILSKLYHAPLPANTSNIQDIAEDSLFDDCSWISRLLCIGIHPKISAQFPQAPKTHPVFVVMNGLRYLEAQMKRRVIDEPMRELIIDVSTSLTQTLESASMDDDNKALEGQDHGATRADRDWLINALARQVQLNALREQTHSCNLGFLQFIFNP
ncbi:hypothetical protein FRC01_004105 [Tulasnella sp. 417]|nr:hypothetical protein FRC01_004105 [Tulasnella sp. 417]